jgi:hypothetical protein
MATDLATTEDPEPIYARMRPDQRTAIGEEFIRLFRLSGDPEAQRLASEVASTFSVPSALLAPEQVAAMHRYARARHPEIFAVVMQHGVTAYALAWLGEAAADQPVRSDRKRGTRDGKNRPRRDRHAA